MTSQIRVDEITNRSGLGTVTIYDNGFEFTGVTTFTEDVDITGGLTIGGVLTYEDVTNIDSVGVITARNGLNVTGGNIGIGENNPQNSLHISGSAPAIRFVDSGANGSAFSIIEDNNGLLKLRNDAGNSGTGSGIAFEVDAAERLRIDDVGRLLIGRTTALASSAERLTIDSGMAIFRRNSTNAAALYIRNEDTTADTRQPYLIFTDGGGNRGGFGVQYNESSLWISGQNGIAFRTSGSAPSQEERVRITSDGKMGLGISSPARGGLHIHKAATAELHLTDDTTGSGSGDGFTLFSTSSSAGVWYRENAPLRFATYNTERVRISSGGNVGINETAPDRFLHVNSGATDTALKLESTDTEVSLELADNTGSSYIGGGGSHLNFYTGGNERARFDSSGNFGLGTNNPNDQTSGGYRSFTVNGSSGGIIDLRRGDIALSGGRLVGLQHEFGIEARSQNSSSQISFYVNNAYTGRWTVDGLCFGNDTAAANALDDYEEGTFTPSLITNGGTGSVGSYGQRDASYTKIGRQVTCFGRLAITNKGTLSGGLAIGNLPFTIANTVSTTGIDGGGLLNYFSGVNSSHYTDFISANPIENTTYFVIYRGNQVGALSGMDQGHINSNFDCRFTVTYFTAS